MTDSDDNKGQMPTVSQPTSQGGTPSTADIPDIEGYRIIDKIGEGGMATVWRAVQLSTQREIALKVLSTGMFGSEKARIRFEREVELTARLEHPNIARVYESGLHKGRYYYAMELFEGQHLDKYILGRQLKQREVLELFHMVCQAVQYAHQQGVIHRDLKPSNIVMTDDGQPHILDFGLAKAFLESDNSLTVSVDGDLAGTPAYMSPEQAAGRFDSIDTRTDVYSVGVIIFNVLTKEWPYDISGSQYEALKNIQEQEPVRPSKLIPHFDSDIEAILLKTLAKEPSERYQSITELANDIHSWLHGFPIAARSVNTWYLLKKLIVRHGTASIILALLLVIVVNTSFISLYSYTQARKALKKSQSAQQIYKMQSEKNLATANQAVFTLFLEYWHDDKIKRAQRAASFFADQSDEKIATLFLLDPRPLSEKKAEFEKRFLTENPCFMEFILGEYHFKNENILEAIKAYKQCLNTERKDSKSDDWFRNRAEVILYQLSNEKIPMESKGGTKGVQK